MEANLLRENWKEKLATLLQCTSDRILISSPFVSRRGIDFLLNHLPAPVQNGGQIRVLANLSPQNVVQGSTEPTSFQRLRDAVPDTVVHHLPGLHAKVYVADTREAIVTSANLTAGGLDQNYEYGMTTADPEAVSVIRQDLKEYADLGTTVNHEELESYVEAAKHARAAFQEKQESQRQAARQRFEEALAEAKDQLIRVRLRGESTNATFAKTILYLLRKKGPMSTAALHPEIQRIHPDLCDDSVDRVIEGENYGKRWKHRVRAAQSTLKQKGEIELVDGKWTLLQE
jgi:HKD family nuclease